MSAEVTSRTKPLQSVRSKSPPPQPSSSSIQVVEDIENIEFTDRTGKGSERANSSVTLSANTNAHRLRARIQFASCCYSMFLAGWNDGSTGPLLPRIQKVYNVSKCRLYKWAANYYN